MNGVTASLVVGLQSTLQFRCRASFQDRPLASKEMTLVILILSKQSNVSLKIQRITNLHPLLVRNDPYQLGGQLLDLVLLLARVLLQHCVLLEQAQIPGRTSRCAINVLSLVLKYMSPLCTNVYPL